MQYLGSADCCQKVVLDETRRCIAESKDHVDGRLEAFVYFAPSRHDLLERKYAACEERLVLIDRLRVVPA